MKSIQAQMPESVRGPKLSQSPLAFTLIELLVVIGIIMTVVSLLSSGTANIGKASALGASGNLVVDLANLAHQTSLTDNSMTALIMLTDSNLPDRCRKFGIFELVPRTDGSTPTSADWKAIHKWETLEPGIIADASTFPDSGNTALQVTPSFPEFTFGGAKITSYKYVIFMPNGSTYNSTPNTLQMAEGYFPSGSSSNPQYTSRTANGSPCNYYLITILNATGRIKVTR